MIVMEPPRRTANAGSGATGNVSALATVKNLLYWYARFINGLTL